MYIVEVKTVDAVTSNVILQPAQSQSTDQVLYGWVNRLESDRGTEVMAGLKPERVNNNLFPSNIDPSPHQAFNQAVVIYLATKTGGN